MSVMKKLWNKLFDFLGVSNLGEGWKRIILISLIIPFIPGLIIIVDYGFEDSFRLTLLLLIPWGIGIKSITWIIEGFKKQNDSDKG